MMLYERLTKPFKNIIENLWLKTKKIYLSKIKIIIYIFLLMILKKQL